MEKALVLRGLLAGAIAGALAFVFGKLFTEPVIQRAIDYESGRDAAQESLAHAAGAAHGHEAHELFSRTTQGGVGVGAGLILFGMAMAGLFVVAYVLLLKRTEGRIAPRTLAILLAVAGFLVVYMVPFLKYPANPPAIGHEETIGARTALYVGMVAITLVALVAAVLSSKALRARFGDWNGGVLAAVGFAVVVGVVMLILPSTGELGANVAEYGRHATETPLPLRGPDGAIVYPGFPADDLAQFRVLSILNQLILWSTIGLVFGGLAERVIAKATQPAQARGVAAASAA